MALVDFPEEYLLQAVATHWTPPKEYAKIAPLISVFSDYYSSRKQGAGAVFREDSEDQRLVDFVASVFRTNRTYLGYVKAIYEFEPILLERVDAGEISLSEANALVPRKTKDGKRKQAKRGEQKTTPRNYLEPVKEFTDDERRLVADNLPERLRVEFDGNPELSPVSVSRQYMYDDVYQGLYVSYQYEGRSVVIQIIDNEGLIESLVA